jgi:hypothetical protein
LSIQPEQATKTYKYKKTTAHHSPHRPTPPTLTLLLAVEIEGVHTKEGREPRENSDLIWKEKKGRASKLCSTH